RRGSAGLEQGSPSATHPVARWGRGRATHEPRTPRALGSRVRDGRGVLVGRVGARPVDRARSRRRRSGHRCARAMEADDRATGAPGADRRATGSFETGSGDPARMPVTQWLNDSIQELDPASWRLHVLSGARSYPVDDLVAFDDTLRATLDCTGGWYAEQEWR